MNQDNYQLPCFYYIIASLKEDDESDMAAFSLSYINYIEKCGVEEPAMIEDAFLKLALFAQFSNVDRKKPLDFLTIGGETFHLDSQASLRLYQKKLLEVCKEPLSFSALLYSSDQNLSLCNLCTFSEKYKNMSQSIELSVSKLLFSDRDTFLLYEKEVTENTFLSWVDLFTMLPRIRKPTCFPALSILYQSVYKNYGTYFGAFFGIDYMAIQEDFIKILKTYGITKTSCAGLESFDRVIYEQLMDTINSSPDLPADMTMDTAISFLKERTRYKPPFDADGIPSATVNLLPSVPEKETDLTDNGTHSTVPLKSSIRRRRRKHGVVEPIVPSPVAQELDAFAIQPREIDSPSRLLSTDAESTLSTSDSSTGNSEHDSYYNSYCIDNESSNGKTYCNSNNITITPDATDIVDSSDEHIISPGEREALPFNENAAFNGDMSSFYDEEDEEWTDNEDIDGSDADPIFSAETTTPEEKEELAKEVKELLSKQILDETNEKENGAVPKEELEVPPAEDISPMDIEISDDDIPESALSGNMESSLDDENKKVNKESAESIDNTDSERVSQSLCKPLN